MSVELRVDESIEALNVPDSGDHRVGLKEAHKIQREINSGYVLTGTQLDRLIEINNCDANSLILDTIKVGYIPSDDQLEKLATKKSEDAHTVLSYAYASGSVPTKTQVGNLIKNFTHISDSALIAASRQGVFPTISQMDKLVKHTDRRNSSGGPARFAIQEIFRNGYKPSEAQVDRWIKARRDLEFVVEYAIDNGYVPTEDQLHSLLNNQAGYALRGLAQQIENGLDVYLDHLDGWVARNGTGETWLAKATIKAGYTPTSQQIDLWLSYGTVKAFSVIDAAISEGYVPTRNQVDKLVQLSTSTTNALLASAFSHGYVASITQVDEWSRDAETKPAARWAADLAFSDAEVVVDVGAVGSGKKMSGHYKSFPNGKGVLEDRLLVKAGCIYFGGETPIEDIQKNIFGVPEQWSGASSEQLGPWRRSVNRGLERIQSAHLQSRQV